MYQWRKFQFFEEKAAGPAVAEEVKEKVVCSTSGRGQIVLGAEDAMLHVLDRGLKLNYSFQAHSERVLHIQQLKQRQVLISLGEDEAPASGLYLKMWDLDKIQPEGSSTTGPACVRSIRVFDSKYPEAQITSFLVYEEAPPILLVCIGLDSGEIYCIRGDIARNRVTRLRLSVDPASADGKIPASPVTGLGFRVEGQLLQLFAVTTSSVNLFDMHHASPHKTVIDQIGAEGRCVAMSDNQDLVVGRPEAVYFYEVDGRGPCWAFEGSKQFVAWFRGYLVVVSADPRKPNKNVLYIYDLKNKLVVYSNSVADVAHILCEWGTIILLTNDQQTLCIAEKDMGSKLDMLFRKSLYTVAINLVQNNQADAAATAEVMRKYGDHLYSKQNYDEAMAQYIRTIGQLEPSYVIQKFLDAQRIHNLTHYLEKLHEKGLATADHTTLLLNCYTKLKDVSKLDDFIKGEEGKEGEPRFDVETAVRVCRAAGYYQHALFVAMRAGEHEWYLKILLEDLKRYEEALQYITGLSLYESTITLKQYGKVLVEHKPAETTAALLKLCTNTGASTPPPAAAAASSSSGRLSSLLPSPVEFIHVFIDQPKWLMVFLEQYIETVKDSPQHTELYNTLLELYLSEDLRTPDLPEESPPPEEPEDSQEPESKEDSEEHHHGNLILAAGGQVIAAGGQVIAAGGHVIKAVGKIGGLVLPIHRRKESVEAVADINPDEEQKEHQIEKIEVVPTEDQVERRAKALTLLKSGWGPHENAPRYDVDLALVLCQMHKFRDGLLFLYEKMKLYKEVLAVYMKDHDYQGLISTCKRLGESARGGDPSLWNDVLSYFGEHGENCSDEVREVLVHIERDELLPPLIVLQKLSKNPNLTLAVVKEYVARQLQQETRLIEEDRKSIEKYQEETAAMRAEVQELRSHARIFQLSKCTACTSALDLPAVHFLCMHSFHQRCLGDNEKECPVCAPANRHVLDMKRSLEANVNDHDTFFQLLRNSDDGFSVIAEYFGRGILNKPAQPRGGAATSLSRGNSLRT
jgi:tetratricopeptide (TPR) repeat protein